MAETVSDFAAASAATRASIERYLAEHYPERELVLSKPPKEDGRSWKHGLAGREAGEQVKLHHAMHGGRERQAIGRPSGA